MAELEGTLVIDGEIDGNIETSQTLSPYRGQYSVIPSEKIQVLETAGKRMDKDVTVWAIPYAETSNGSDGFTVTIGG